MREDDRQPQRMEPKNAQGALLFYRILPQFTPLAAL